MKTSLQVGDLALAKWAVRTGNAGGSGWTDPRRIVAAGHEDDLHLYRVVQVHRELGTASVQSLDGGPSIVVFKDRDVIPVSVLILDDGKRYTGTPRFNDDGKPEVALAQCGHCNFVWNDELSTQLTPPPSARCPNEYNHVHPEPEVATPSDVDSWVDDEEDSGWFAMIAVGRRDEEPITYLTPAQAREYADRLVKNAEYADMIKARKDGS